MVEMRNIRRAESRKRRVLERLGADQRELTKHLRIGKVLEQLRLIVVDDIFSKLIHTHGIQSIPELLVKAGGEEGLSLDRSLDFIVAWRFFSPFLYDPVTATLLDNRWPGFAIEMKDIFILIVADGPFPHEIRGRERRVI